MMELVVMRVMPVLGVVMILVSQSASQSVTNTQASATQEHSFAFISSQDFKAIMGKYLIHALSLLCAMSGF